MSKKLTPWFWSSEFFPARAGVYQARPIGIRKPYYSYFDGERFHGCWGDPEEAESVRWVPGRWWSTVGSWRGLAKAPK